MNLPSVGQINPDLLKTLLLSRSGFLFSEKRIILLLQYIVVSIFSANIKRKFSLLRYIVVKYPNCQLQIKNYFRYLLRALLPRKPLYVPMSVFYYNIPSNFVRNQAVNRFGNI